MSLPEQRTTTEAAKSPDLEVRGDPRYKVFFRLQELAGGHLVADSIIPSVLSGEVDRVIWLGPPGAGKTTCCVQAESYLGDQHGKKIRSVRYDEMLRSTAEELGRPDKEWDANDWNHFSGRYHEALLHQEDDEVIFAEVVAVGEKDRGRQGLIDLCQDPEESSRTRIFGFVADRDVSVRARELRKAVGDAEPHEVLDVLRECRMQLSGHPNPVSPGQRIALGVRIKEIFAKMASPEWIQIIDEEIGRLSAPNSPQATERINELAKYLSEEERLPDYAYDDASDEFNLLIRRRDAMYMATLGGNFGSIYAAVYNKRIRGEIVWPWSEFATETNEGTF